MSRNLPEEKGGVGGGHSLLAGNCKQFTKEWMKIRLEGMGRQVAGKDAKAKPWRSCRPCHEREFRYYFAADGDLLQGFKQWSTVVRFALYNNSTSNQRDVLKPKSDVTLLFKSFQMYNISLGIKAKFPQCPKTRGPQWSLWPQLLPHFVQPYRSLYLSGVLLLGSFPETLSFITHRAHLL